MNHFKYAIICTVCGVLTAAGFPVHALPTGSVVTAGQADLDTVGSNMTITQKTDPAILEHQDFSIGSGETVQFVQPSSTSVALNRVTGGNVSQIMGNLAANGRLFLVNTNGILFGQNARVDVMGMVASTLDITDQDFLDGNYVFNGSGAAVINDGALRTTTSQNGFLILLGNHVENNGLMRTDAGRIAMAAGEKITVNLDGDGLIDVVVDEKVTVNIGGERDAVLNTGTLDATGGKVLLTARTLDTIFDYAVNNDGIIEAGRVRRAADGEVVLTADHDIRVAGQISGGDVAIDSTVGNVNHADGGQVDTSSTGGFFRGFAGIDYMIEDSADITVGNGLLDILAGNGLTMGAGGVLLSSSADVFLSAGDGGIRQESGAVLADRLVLTSAGGASGPAFGGRLFTSINEVSGVNTSSGGLGVYSNQSFRVSDLSGLSGLNSGSAGVNGLHNSADGGALSLRADGVLMINAPMSTVRGDIELAALSSIRQNNDIDIIGNNTLLGIPDSVHLTSPSHTPGVASTDNTIETEWQVEDAVFEQDPGEFKALTGLDYIMAEGVGIETGGGDAAITAFDDVFLTLVNADVGAVNIAANNGSIVDNDLGIVPGDYDVIAHNIQLNAPNGSVGDTGPQEQIDVGAPYTFSHLWIQNADADPDSTADDFVSTLNELGEWVFSTISPELAESDNWWFHVATADPVSVATSDTASIGPFVIDLPEPPPGPTPAGRGFGEEYTDRTPAYYEILAPSQYLSFEPATSIGLYAYHPLTPVDQSAFDDIDLDIGAYEFIEDNLKKRRDFAPYFGE
ncbi:MAG: filamentous hemagglutinin N-terminal domain-containing protein [Candidatus Omnitrophota bacterium]